MSGDSTEQVRFIKFVMNDQTFLVPTKEAVESLIGKHFDGKTENVVELVNPQ